MLAAIGKPLNYEGDVETVTQETAATTSEARQVDQIKSKVADTIF